MTEIEMLRAENARLQAENARLNTALDNAYSINAREASMEAERIRATLHKDFSYLYDDWCEYTEAPATDINYQTLNVIIKKMFRALRRVNINID